MFEHSGLSSAGHAPRKTPRHDCRLTPVTGKAFDCPLHYFRQTLPIVVQRYAGQNAHGSITWSPWRPIISKDAVKDALRAGVTKGVNYLVLHVVTLMGSHYDLIASRAFLNRVGGYLDTAREVIDGFS